MTTAATYKSIISSVPVSKRSLAHAYLQGLAAGVGLTSAQTPAQPVLREQPADVPSISASANANGKMRANLVSEIWEPELRVELVDRIVAAYDRGWIDAVSLRAAIKRAQDRKSEYDRTNGARGKDAVWKTLASWCKGIYETNGYEWRATASALEPRPQKPAARRRVIFADGATADLDELNEQED